MKLYKKCQGAVLLFTLGISTVILVIISAVNYSVLKLENKSQFDQLNAENDRLSHLTLRDFENRLGSLSKIPEFVDETVQGQEKIDLSNDDQWIIHASLNSIPENTISRDSFGKSLLWWQQPLSWWEDNAYEYTPSFPVQNDQKIHVFVIQNDTDNSNKDLGQSNIYSINTELFLFDIYVRIESKDGATRKIASQFSKLFFQ